MTMADKEKIDAMDSNEVTIKRCHSYDSFVSELRASRFSSRIFRGQRDPKWPLCSIWDRQRKLLRDGIDSGDGLFKERTGENVDELYGTPECTIRYRDRHRELFVEYLRDLPEVPDEFLDDPIKTWALGRHFGLATPLLDWTRNPFIALYFACFDQIAHVNPGLVGGIAGRGIGWSSNDSIAVWELAISDKISVEGEFTIVHNAAVRGHRQKAQRSIFTMLTHSVHLDLEAYLKDRNLAIRLTRYELNGLELGKALCNLQLMNITHAALFPDFEGAAVAANVSPVLEHLRFSYLTDPSDA